MGDCEPQIHPVRIVSYNDDVCFFSYNLKLIVFFFS